MDFNQYWYFQMCDDRPMCQHSGCRCHDATQAPGHQQPLYWLYYDNSVDWIISRNSVIRLKPLNNVRQMSGGRSLVGFFAIGGFIFSHRLWLMVKFLVYPLTMNIKLHSQMCGFGSLYRWHNNSIANTLELMQSCTKPSISFWNLYFILIITIVQHFGDGRCWFAFGIDYYSSFRISSYPHDDVIKWKHVPLTGQLCGEFTGHRWISRTKASDAELWCFLDLRLNKRLSKKSLGWWFETPSRPLLRHCNGMGPWALIS